MEKTKRIYKIKNKNTGEYLTTGLYSRKSSWLVFPHQAIKCNRLSMTDYIVDVFELVKSKSLNLEGNDLSNEN